MKPNEHVVATASRIEYEQTTGRLFIVFEVTDEYYKQKIKKDWLDDI